jgi:hypothetical protein
MAAQNGPSRPSRALALKRPLHRYADYVRLSSRPPQARLANRSLNPENLSQCAQE